MKKFFSKIWSSLSGFFKTDTQAVLKWALKTCEEAGMKAIRELAERTANKTDDELVKAIEYYRANGKVDPNWRYNDAIRELAKFILRQTPGVPPLAGFVLNWVVETLFIRYQEETGKPFFVEPVQLNLPFEDK